jgi:hypothetical protein
MAWNPYGIYPPVKTKADRIKELEVENVALKAERDKLNVALNEIAYIVNCKAYNMEHGSAISKLCNKALRGVTP